MLTVQGQAASAGAVCDPFERLPRDLDPDVIAARIDAARARLGSRLTILGHHYQRDRIVAHADALGDSFKLAQFAADAEAELIVFCGVHFMAEAADVLTRPDQTVFMPNVRAGCSMADMAALEDVEAAWDELLAETGLADPIDRADPTAPAAAGERYLVPVTYMNSAADLKAFVGEHGGVVCTSSNAAGVLEWAFERAGDEGAVLFFPDQHLGRNTGLAMGLEAERMVTWSPDQTPDWEALEQARIILWHGYCSVHRRFTTDQIDTLRAAEPDARIVVHPECVRDVVEAADAVGSTEFIKQYVESQPAGSIIGVGTEINMVRRLDAAHPDKDVRCLDPLVCPCSTMYMIHPIYLLDLLERLVDGERPNVISVPEATAHWAAISLERMLAIPK